MTLIEIMVSVVILAVGMLGIAGLHALGTKYGNQSYFRSQAVNQAYDILDRMRANPAGASIGGYDRSGSSSAASADCVLSSCSAPALAEYDLGDWNELNETTLPSGSGSVTTDGSEVSVIVTWREVTRHGGEPETASVEVRARL